jgi:outer membrane protein assembly factor BamB
MADSSMWLVSAAREADSSFRALKPLLSLILITLLAVVPVHAQDQRPEDNWPMWRGPLGTGAAPYADPPVEWSEETNVRWKTALPGLGHSSPVVWGDRIFLTTAIPVGTALPPRHSRAPGAHDNLPVTHKQQFIVLAVNRSDGSIAWQQPVHEELPHEGWHQTASAASISPVTDGRHVIASFGSYGVYCLDVAGNEVWRKQLGKLQIKHGHGESSTPALHGDTVIVNWDQEKGSFIVALDKETGDEKWRKPRDEETSWSSPIVIEHEGRPQVVVSGTNRIRGYELETGRVLWECGGLSSNIVASPVYDDGMVFAGSSYESRALLAIRLKGALGDVTGTSHVAWSRNERTPYVPSPLLYEGGLYFLYHYQGVLSRVTAKSGEEPTGPFRLPEITDIYSSPVAAFGRLYITDREGTTLVMSSQENPSLLARNHLDDQFSASAALAGTDLFMRGEKSLYCLSDQARREAALSGE